MQRLRQNINHLAPFVVVSLLLAAQASADSMDNYVIGGHGQANIKYPTWFKQSFYDLRDDLAEARAAGKRGIIVFFSQKNCNHCQAFLATTLSDPATRSRVRKSYDVIGLDIFNDIELTEIDGKITTIKKFAEDSRARLTPTLIFYGVEGVPLLKIIGFYPPEKFNRVLDYVEGGHYQTVRLNRYLQGEKSPSANRTVLKPDYSLFAKPPHRLQRNKQSAQKPLIVVFTRDRCIPCQRFDNRVLKDQEVRTLAQQFDMVQLDVVDNDSQVTLPDGRRLTPQQWVAGLGLLYDVAAVFFDVNGKEVHRLDAETGRDRMTGSMQYVLEKAYLRHEQFLQWRKESAIKRRVSK